MFSQIPFVLLIVGFVILIVIIGALREVFCWYFKINQRLEELEKMNRLLKQQNNLLSSESKEDYSTDYTYQDNYQKSDKQEQKTEDNYEDDTEKTKALSEDDQKIIAALENMRNMRDNKENE